MSIDTLISDGKLRQLRRRETLLEESAVPYLLLNPHDAKCEIAENGKAMVVVAYTEPTQSRVEFALGRNATLSLVELYLAKSLAHSVIHQQSGSRSSVVKVVLEGSSAATRIALEGEYVESELDALFMAVGSEHCTIDVDVRHMQPNGKSRSLVKGVAMERATGEFRGMVYVAQDAQQTDAEQQSKNIELDQSRINAMPQLEIYADDVRCSHGATVGKSDDDAMFYMRQRGLSENDARRLQIEGFVNDIIERCPVESISQLLCEEVAKRLERV